MEEHFDNNFDNTNSELPEGLEFKSEYMHQAFQMYEKAKKERRKKRFIIWFFRTGYVLAGTGIIFGLFHFFKMETKSNNQRISVTKIEKLSVSYDKKIIDFKKYKNQDIQLSDKELQAQKINFAAKNLIENKQFLQQKDRKNLIISSLNTNSSNNSTLIANSQNTNEFSDPTFSQQDKTKEKFLLKKEEIDSTILSENPEIDSMSSNYSTDLIEKNIANLINTLNQPLIRKHNFYFAFGITHPVGYSAENSFGNIRENYNLTYRYNSHGKLAYGMTSSLFSISKINTSQIFSNNQGEQLSVRTKSIQYFALSPQIYYGFTPKHLLKLGLGTEFLIPNRNREITSSPAFKTSNYSIYDNFKRVNYFIVVGTEIKIRKALSLDLTYQHGLTDVTKNNFSNNKKDLNSRFTIGINFFF